MSDEENKEKTKTPKKKRAYRKKAKAKPAPEPKCSEDCDGNCETCVCDFLNCPCKEEKQEMEDPKEEVIQMVAEPVYVVKKKEKLPVGRESVPTTARKLSGIRKEKSQLARKYLGKARRY